MKVVVDRERCLTHGQCAFFAPAVFDIDDDDEPPESLRGDVLAAVNGCPEAAIRLRG